MSSYPFNILNTSIKSPLSFLVSIVVNPIFLISFHTLILKNHLSYSCIRVVNIWISLSDFVVSADTTTGQNLDKPRDVMRL